MRYHAVLFTVGLMVGCGGASSGQNGDVALEDAEDETVAQEAEDKDSQIAQAVAEPTSLRVDKETIKTLSNPFVFRDGINCPGGSCAEFP